MRHLIPFTKDQISIIETSLEASLKYADSEYIELVDEIMKEIKENTRFGGHFEQLHIMSGFTPLSDYNNTIDTNNTMKPVKGWNIELSTSQFDYLCQVLMDANDDNKIVGRGWDIQTFDNLIDNVCNAKETYLSNGTKGVLV